MRNYVREIIIIMLTYSILYYIMHFFTRKYEVKEEPEENLYKYVKKYPIINNDKFLFQTYYKKSKIPKDIYSNIKLFAPEYKHVILDDNEIRNFLKEHFTDDVLETFNSLKEGAHKADLARYCLLYMYGGIYLDIKTELIQPINTIFTDNSIIYTVVSTYNDHIYQGIIHTPPNQDFFLKLINFIVIKKNPDLYLDFCKDFYNRIISDVGSIKLGFSQGKNNKFHLFQEKCSSTDDSMCYDGFDRYKLCCFVWDDKKPIIKVRRSSYPW